MDTSNIYNRKIRWLSGLVGVLALLYVGTLIFDPERVTSRNALFVWFDAKQLDQADRIEISGTEGDITLLRKNKLWFVFRDTREYPAKQTRVEELLRILSTKGTYPLQGTRASSHEPLGLTLDTASRIIIRGGASVYPLLDLLVGNGDTTGREVYLRKNGENEVRSGDHKLSGYINSRSSAWFNLRLFPEEENPGLKSELVQRLTVSAPISLAAREDTGEEPPIAAAQTRGAPLVLSRNEDGWSITGASISKLDNQRVESYIRSILEVEGEDFLSAEDTLGSENFNIPLNPDPPEESRSPRKSADSLNEGQILLELGNGKTLTLKVGHTLASNQWSARVLGSPLIYALPEWTMGRLFRDGSYFEQP